jgi:hypothetical protein
MQEAYDEEYDTYFIANTAEVSDDTIVSYKNKAFDSSYAVILLNNKVIIGIYGDISEYTYADLCERLGMTEFNKTELINLLDENAVAKLGITLFLVSGCSIYITQIISMIMNVLILFIFAYFTARIFRVPLKIGSIFNISVYSLSLSTIISLIYNVVYYFTNFNIPYFDMMYLLIAYIYVVSAILIIKSDLLKIKNEVQKIVEVQKEVAEELKDKEEKKDEKENKDKDKEDNSDSNKEKDNKENSDEDENAEPDGSEI